jgi:hypothetical protein
LRYASRDGALRDLVALSRRAPLVTLEWRHACAAATFDSSEDGRAAMGTRGATAFHVLREPRSIVFDIPVEPPPDALIHPLATVPLAILARWRGDVTLHGGAFAARNAAWALIGDRHAGKSTSLGMLAPLGHPVVTDDLIVVRDGQVWSGPHCVDLREDAAERLGPTRDLGLPGARRRLRLSCEPVPERLPLGGFFLLDWHDRSHVAVERLPLSERIRVLYRLEYAALVGPADPKDILELATLPAWRIVRPKEWSAAEEMSREILEIVEASVGSRTTRSEAT